MPERGAELAEAGLDLTPLRVQLVEPFVELFGFLRPLSERQARAGKIEALEDARNGLFHQRRDRAEQEEAVDSVALELVDALERQELVASAELPDRAGIVLGRELRLLCELQQLCLEPRFEELAETVELNARDPF